jgi:hypothetical protein
MRAMVSIACVAFAGLLGTAAVDAADPRQTPLEGEGASIEYRGEGEPDRHLPAGSPAVHEPRVSGCQVPGLA